MPAPSTADEFLKLVAKSDLLLPNVLDEFVARRRAENSLPTELVKLAQLMIFDGILTKYQAEQILSGRWRNFIIGGKYKLLERLGKGGMALVFLCEHQVMKRLVALKILPSAHASDRELLGRFHREARALSSLRHPNIVGAYDADHASKVHFLVMEYVDGGDLDQIVQRSGPMDWERAAHYIQQAANGLQHAHECGLVHRDIKPGNVLVDRTGTVKLLDLGLARIFHETTDDLTTGRDAKTLLGTVDYLAPEQALNSHDVDIRADIYGLGATFYYLLTGKGLFEDGSVAQKLSWHLHRPPTPISDLRDDVPRELIHVIDMMLAKNPDDRYQTPAEVVEALEPFTQDPIAPPRPEDLPQISKAARNAAPNSSVRLTVPSSKTSQGSGPKSTTNAASFLKTASNQKTSTTSRPAQKNSRIAAGTTPVAQIRRETAARSSPQPKALWYREPRYLAAMVLGTLAVAAGGFWLFSGSSQPSTKTPDALPPPSFVKPEESANSQILTSLPPNPAHSTEVQADVSVALASGSGTPRAFPSLRDAIRVAKPGDKIVVRGALLTDALELSDVDGAPKDLTIEGINPKGKGQLVRWRAPKDLSAGRALLDVSGLDGFKLKGFLFDGQNRVLDLIRLSGRGAGSTLESLHLENATRALVVLKGWTGESSRPASIQDVRFSTANEAEAAILFETDTDRPTVASELVKIYSCRFVGPFQAALMVVGPINGLEVEQCRFLGATDGLRYRRSEPHHPLRVRVSNNTFADLQRGLHFETTPPAATSDLVVTNNVFSATPRIAMLDKVSVQPQQVFAKWIWTDEPRKTATVPPGSRHFRKTFDVASIPEKSTLDISCDETFTVWLNGVEIARNPSPHYTQRVFSYNISGKLRRGKNSMAIQGTNQLDRLDSQFGTTAGLLAQITTPLGSREVVLAKTDETWKSSDQSPAGWNRPEFDDQSWGGSKLWSDDGVTWPWKFAVWDSAVLPQLKAPLEPINVTASGNVRDYKSWEGYPTIDSERIALQESAFSKNPADDLTFLRYSKSHPLATGGPGGSPIGAFDEK